MAYLLRPRAGRTVVAAAPWSGRATPERDRGARARRAAAARAGRPTLEQALRRPAARHREQVDGSRRRTPSCAASWARRAPPAAGGRGGRRARPGARGAPARRRRPPARPRRRRCAGCARRVAELEADLGRRPGGPSATERGDGDAARAAAARHGARRRRRGCSASWRCPRSTGSPADRVEAALAAGGLADLVRAGRRWPPTTRRCSSSCCALPRAHLVVDGYNVSKPPGPSSTLEKQREPAARAGSRRCVPAPAPR